MIPLVMISPFGDALWAAQSRHFQTRCEVICLGLGQADTLEAMARSILSGAPRLFAVAGHCIGGYVAVEMALRYRERVAGIALFNSSARADNPREAALRRGRMARIERAAEFQEGSGRHYVEEAMSWMVASQSARQPDVRHAAERALKALAPGASLKLQRAIAQRDDLRATLATIDVPTLAVAGADDRIVDPLYSLDFECVARCVARTLSACGHLAPIEAATEVNALLAAWLDECEARVIRPA